MTTGQPVHGGERGSVTIFFILMALVLLGVTAYSVYMGRAVDQKMRVETAADTTALAMANHAAMGLNMISANNLAIAANLHVAAAVPFIGRYYALLRAMTADNYPELVDAEAIIYNGVFSTKSPDSTVFANAYGPTEPMAAFFTMTAAGMTTVNRKVASLWLKGAFIKGAEQMRINSPGAIGLPIQAANLGGSLDVKSFFSYRYHTLAQTDATKAMCHTIKSSEVLGNDRNSAAFWLGAPLVSVAGMVPGGEDLSKGLVDGLSTIESMVQTVGNIFNDATSVLQPIVDTLGVGCDAAGWLDPSETCKRVQDARDAIDAKELIPFPRFEGCGMPLSGDYGSQFAYFADGDQTVAHQIGFLFPNVDAGSVDDFEKSLQFAAVVGNPQFISEELPHAAGNAGASCPEGWSSDINGRRYCSALFDGMNLGTASRNKDADDFDLAAGGVGRAVGDNDGQAGRMRLIWSRVQWAVGQAKAEYEPVAGQQDPTAADARAVDPVNRGAMANMRRLELFWPAWRGRNMEASVTGDILRLLGLK